MANGHNHQPNKQGALMSLKGYIYIYIYICGVHLGLLPQTFPGGSYLWVISVSISFFAIFGWLLPMSQTLLFRVPCASVLVYMFNSKKDMYFNSIFFSSDLPWGFMPTYSIPEGDVYKFLGNSNSGGSP